SDIWALAGSVAVTGTGGPLLPFRCGRVDYGPGQGVPPPRLPDATRGEDHLRDVFITNMGFDEWELVALSGAHSLGRAHSDRSGFDGPWTRRPNTFSNSYFGILTDTRPFRPITAPNNNTQFVYSDSQLMMLPSDMALVESNALRYYWNLLCAVRYAANSTLFFDVFARAWVKLVELG
ncbi:heme peroxidase, partial [Gonapodya prolifera JEL478]